MMPDSNEKATAHPHQLIEKAMSDSSTILKAAKHQNGTACKAHEMTAAGPAAASSAPDLDNGIQEQPLTRDNATHDQLQNELTVPSSTTNGDMNSSFGGLSVDQEWERDSAIGSEYGSSTDSVHSSIYEFVEENGRRYHKYKEGKYLLPNDEEEQDRLNLQHQIMCLTLNGKLHCAPLSTLPSGIHNVLDLATGTGTWAIDFAQEYPSANVLGTDLSPIQPSFVPPNCRFEVDDAEDEWTFGEKFEYIHGRMLASCFASHRDVFRSCVEALRPGGWLEMQDVGFPFRCVDGSWEGTTFQRWNNLWVEAVSKIGKDFDKARFYKQYMEDVGLVDVTEMRLAWPVGSWAKGSRMKMIGVLAKQDVLQGLDSWSMALFTRGLGMPVEEIKALLKEVEEDLNTKRLHVYVPIYVVHGRKPEQ